MSLRFPIDGILEDIGTELEPITIERTAAPTENALGRLDHGTPTETPAQAVVHQATRAQLERAELDYGPNYRAFYTREPLRTADGTVAPDVVVYDGRRWTIVEAADGYSELAGLYLALGSLRA
ncbi:MAG: hypothetical protein VYA51_12735 [Planctomycetota bacterium]|nr:hypothetical protein [Planctomycetota bacterium]